MIVHYIKTDNGAGLRNSKIVDGQLEYNFFFGFILYSSSIG